MASPLFREAARLAPEIRDALSRGALVLTATARAARAVQGAHARDQQAMGIGAWISPRIHDWASWTNRLWQQHALEADLPMVLSPMQEHALWLRVQQLEGQVVAPERLAELAAEAYRLLGAYRAHGQRRAPWGSHEDATHFLVWAEEFDRQCARGRWISASRMDGLLAEALQSGTLTAPPEMVLAGFDRVTPSQQHLLDRCAARGAVITHAASPEAATPRVLAARSQLEEFAACAWWARAQIARQPEQRIGIVVPALEPLRAGLDRALGEVLLPHGVAPGSAPLWEFSLGSPLATVPLIHAALLTLKWLDQSLAPDEGGWLLSSGFLAASAQEADALAQLRPARRSLIPGLSLATLATQRLPADFRASLKALQAFLGANQFSSAERSYSAWADLAQAALRTAGWPGYQEADSAQFQARQRWDALLDQVALLAFDGARVSWTAFLGTLASRAHAALFSLESEGAPIQILGAFEASGLAFDALWFLGVDDQRWPATGRAHPLLPVWLQRATAMPHGTPEADWALSEQVTRRIAASAAEVTISYALQEKEIELRPSPLIAAVFPGVAAALAALPAEAALLVHKPALLEEAASALVPWPAAQPAGGAEILRRQAACAFQSFAAKRFSLRDDSQAALGLDPMERGTLIHAVLERLWSAEPGEPLRLHSLADLERASRDGSLPRMLDAHIDAALAATLPEAAGADAWTPAYVAVEKLRIRTLLLEWLACEQQRAAFTIAGLECRLPDVVVGGLRLNLRVDRVDRLSDDTQLLVDYKTSAVSAAKWEGERPDEPQLPLYFTCGGVAEAAGIAFAQVKARDAKLVARTARPEAVLAGSSAVTVLADVDREEWARGLSALALDFLRGEAAVDPKHPGKTCKYCGLQSLCRVQELEREDEDEEDEEAAMAEVAD